MKSVGIRNLKNQLSKYIGMVREGEVVLVTDRDEVVAQIMPPAPLGMAEPGSRDRAQLARLSALGQLRLGRRQRGPRPPLRGPAAPVDVALLLDETRADR